jgi:hypothetical protein
MYPYWIGVGGKGKGKWSVQTGKGAKVSNNFGAGESSHDDCFVRAVPTVADIRSYAPVCSGAVAESVILALFSIGEIDKER